MSVKEVASTVKECVEYHDSGTGEFRVQVEKFLGGSSSSTSSLITGIDEVTEQAFRGENVEYTTDNPNVIIRVDYSEGENNVVLEPSLSSNSGYFACVLQKQIAEGTANLSVSTNRQASMSEAMELRIIVSQQQNADGTQPLPDRVLGRFIGKTLAIYKQ